MYLRGICRLVHLSIIFIPLKFSACMIPSAGPLSGVAKSVQAHDTVHGLGQLEKKTEGGIIEYSFPNVQYLVLGLDELDRKAPSSKATATCFRAEKAHAGYNEPQRGPFATNDAANGAEMAVTRLPWAAADGPEASQRNFRGISEKAEAPRLEAKFEAIQPTLPVDHPRLKRATLSGNTLDSENYPTANVDSFSPLLSSSLGKNSEKYKMKQRLRSQPSTKDKASPSVEKPSSVEVGSSDDLIRDRVLKKSANLGIKSASKELQALDENALKFEKYLSRQDEHPHIPVENPLVKDRLNAKLSSSFSPWNGRGADFEEFQKMVGNPSIAEQIVSELDWENQQKYDETRMKIRHKNDSGSKESQALRKLVRQLLGVNAKAINIPIDMIKERQYKLLCNAWYNNQEDLMNELSSITGVLGELEATKRINALSKQVKSITISKNWKSFKDKVLKANMVLAKDMDEIEKFYLPSVPFPDLCSNFPADFKSISSRTYQREIKDAIEMNSKEKNISILSGIMGRKGVIDRLNTRLASLRAGPYIPEWWVAKNLRKAVYERGVEISVVIIIGNKFHFEINSFDFVVEMRHLESAVHALDEASKYNSEKQLQWFHSPERHWLIKNFEELYHRRLNNILGAISFLEDSEKNGEKIGSYENIMKINRRIKKEIENSELKLNLADYLRFQEVGISSKKVLECRAKMIEKISSPSFNWYSPWYESLGLEWEQKKVMEMWLKTQK